jgi:hemerythrin-like metal-binding protein
MEPCSWKLDWNDDMGVGIPEVDQEHRQFIQSINDLNLAIASRMDLAEIQRRIQLILNNADLRFTHEERLLKQWNYPDVDDHANKHTQAKEALHKIMAQCTKDSLEPHWIAAALEVKNILVNHLMTEDMKFRDYFHNLPQGIR